VLSQLSADGSEVVSLGSPPTVEAAATLVSMLLLKVPHLALATHRSDARVGGLDAEASMMGPPPTLTLQVSPNHVGLVIGAKGSNVNNVKALPGIHRVLVQDDGSILVWADSLPEAEAARRHLEIHTEHYPLRAEEVGWVIGKQGKHIVSLQQLSSSHIVIKSAGEVRDAVEAQRAAAEGGGGGHAPREQLDSSGDAHARPESGGAGGSVVRRLSDRSRVWRVAGSSASSAAGGAPSSELCARSSSASPAGSAPPSSARSAFSRTLTAAQPPGRGQDARGRARVCAGRRTVHSACGEQRRAERPRKLVPRLRAAPRAPRQPRAQRPQQPARARGTPGGWGRVPGRRARERERARGPGAGR